MNLLQLEKFWYKWFRKEPRFLCKVIWLPKLLFAEFADSNKSSHVTEEFGAKHFYSWRSQVIYITMLEE